MRQSEKHKVKHKRTAQEAYELLCKYGKEASQIAKTLVYQENIENNSVREALHYFMQEVWHDEEYPGFIALACRTVGGEPSKTSQLGASIVLIRGAMDIHDDIIDEQITKSGKPTLFGKYGRDLSIIVGDILFYKGLTHLYETISQLPKKEGQTIANMVKNAIFEVGTGVASEIDFRKNLNLPPENLMKIITKKSGCAEVCARVGAIVGGGNETEVDALGRFGRLFAVLTMMRDEFIDIYEPEELQNRKEKECLPLPILFAFKDKNVKKRILPILEKRELSDEDSETIIEIISQSKEVKSIKNQIGKLKRTALLCLELIKDKKSTPLLTSLLDPICEDL
jgi:geranylgeranyl pyrophosphate synthase